MGRKPKAIRQYDGKTGLFIREYSSMSLAAKKTNTSASSIKHACEIEIRCDGYYWRYSVGKKLLKVKARVYRRGGKKVRVYKTRTGGKPRKFTLCDTISEAVNLTGISHTTIRNICRGKISQYKGFTFEFVNEEDNWNRTAEFNLYKNKKRNPRPYYKCPVKLTKDNNSYKFDSIAEASRELNINYKSLINVLAGRWQTAAGYLVVRDI